MKGGPSKNAAQLSSLPVTSRYGRLCLMSTLLMILLCPVISPTEEPLSHRKTAPNLDRMRGVTGEKKSVPEGQRDLDGRVASAPRRGALTAPHDTHGAVTPALHGVRPKRRGQAPLGRDQMPPSARPGAARPPVWQVPRKGPARGPALRRHWALSLAGWGQEIRSFHMLLGGGRGLAPRWHP